MRTALILLFPLILHASSQDRAQKFFVDHYEAAEQLYFCDGIPIELSLAVWALESKYGSSTAAKYNNLGGVKVYIQGKKQNKRFATKYGFYRSFAAIFQQPCYRNDLRPKTVEQYLEAMEYACCSYHRSKEYTKKIKWIIKRYKLDKMGRSINVSFKNCKEKEVKIYKKKDFPKNVLAFLEKNQFSDLYILSDFYEACCLYLNLDIKGKTYESNISKIRYRLKKMKKQKLIDWRRCGTGMGGGSTFGMTSLNSYALFDHWNTN